MSKKIFAFILAFAICLTLTTGFALAAGDAEDDAPEGVWGAVTGFVEGLLDKLEELVPGLPRWSLVAMIIAGPALLLAVVITIIVVAAARGKRRRAAVPAANVSEEDTRVFRPQGAPERPAAQSVQQGLYCECGAALKPTMKYCPLCGKPTGGIR